MIAARYAASKEHSCVLRFALLQRSVTGGRQEARKARTPTALEPMRRAYCLEPDHRPHHGRTRAQLRSKPAPELIEVRSPLRSALSLE